MHGEDAFRGKERGAGGGIEGGRALETPDACTSEPCVGRSAAEVGRLDAYAEDEFFFPGVHFTVSECGLVEGFEFCGGQLVAAGVGVSSLPRGAANAARIERSLFARNEGGQGVIDVALMLHRAEDGEGVFFQAAVDIDGAGGAGPDGEIDGVGETAGFGEGGFHGMVARLDVAPVAEFGPVAEFENAHVAAEAEPCGTHEVACGGAGGLKGFFGFGVNRLDFGEEPVIADGACKRLEAAGIACGGDGGAEGGDKQGRRLADVGEEEGEGAGFFAYFDANTPGAAPGMEAGDGDEKFRGAARGEFEGVAAGAAGGGFEAAQGSVYDGDGAAEGSVVPEYGDGFHGLWRFGAWFHGAPPGMPVQRPGADGRRAGAAH